jgi:hypothetical protein
MLAKQAWTAHIAFADSRFRKHRQQKLQPSAVERTPVTPKGVLSTPVPAVLYSAGGAGLSSQVE